MQESPERREGYVAVHGTQIYYQEAGAGHPLVLLHAGVANHTMWDRQFDVFARKYRTIRYDLRGFGRTAMPPGAFSPHEDLHGLLEALDIAQPYLVGISMGGSTVIDYAITHPGRAAGIVLVACSIGGAEPSEEAKAAYSRFDEPYEARDLERVLELEEQLWLVGPRRDPGAVSPELKEWFRRMERHNLQLEFAGEEGTREPLNPPAVTRLSEIRVPTLYIAGDADLPDVVRTAGLIAGHIAGAKTVILPNAAHMLPMEAPEEFNRLVLEFLDDVGSRG